MGNICTSAGGLYIGGGTCSIPPGRWRSLASRKAPTSSGIPLPAFPLKSEMPPFFVCRYFGISDANCGSSSSKRSKGISSESTELLPAKRSSNEPKACGESSMRMRIVSEPVSSSYSNQKPRESESNFTPEAIHSTSFVIAPRPEASCALPALSLSGSGREYPREPIRACQLLPLILSVNLSTTPSSRASWFRGVSNIGADSLGGGG
mmetsp:Transcript_24986/g.68590  ORF Transcript_24986/g.68590 Transcript_24986/m.68590 type:complete len:207 (+) Transcript_24986:7168-7788(+)